MKLRQLSCATALLFFVAASDASLAGQTLPLREGVYVSGACDNPPDRYTSIGIFVMNDGKKPSRQIIFPTAEGIEGYCAIRQIKTSKNVYSSSVLCDSGSKHDPSKVMYKFSYTIADQSTFDSRGKTYRWCAAHR